MRKRSPWKNYVLLFLIHSAAPSPLKKVLEYTGIHLGTKMKIFLLLSISGILLLHLQGTFGKGRKKNNDLLNDPNIRKSPLFCPLKYELCLKHPKKGRNPTPDSCTQRIARKYLCSEKDINRPYTENEKTQFLGILGASKKGSRTFRVDLEVVSAEEVDSGISESSEETVKVNPEDIKSYIMPKSA